MTQNYPPNVPPQMPPNYQQQPQRQFSPNFQQPPQQAPYGYPQGQMHFQNSMIPQGYSKTVTMGDWFIFMILQCIPFVNLIMLIVYAVDKDKPSRASFARLSLLMMIISSVIAIIAFVIALICGFTFSR